MTAPRSGARPHVSPHVSLFYALVCVLAFALLSGCGNKANLQVGLNDADANEIVTLLSRYGIEARKVSAKDGVTLTLDAADISRATTAMHAAGLPRRQQSSLGQVFKKDSMISTPLEERARYIHGLSAELQSTLLQFDHVIEARVHVVLPERVAPGEPVTPSSAAVFIKYHPPIDEDTMLPRIRQLVAASIPGLGGEGGRSKVSVVMAASDYTAPVIEWTKVGPFRVQAGSAMALTMTLIGLAILLAFMLIGTLFVLARHHPSLAARLKQHFGKAPPLEAAPTSGGT